MIYKISDTRIANLSNADDIGVFLLNGTDTFQLLASFGKHTIVLRNGTQEKLVRELAAIATGLIAERWGK